MAPNAGTPDHTVIAALSRLPLDQQRFALFVVKALDGVVDESHMPETEVRNLIYRVVQAGLMQARRAPGARRELARALGPSLADLDPVPYATVEQARRLSALRGSLLRQGALSTAAVAEARSMTANNARQWISRNRKAFRLFTVTHDGETLVPAFLLDDELDPRAEAMEPIRALREAGDDGWALWAWFATPSVWLGDRAPADVLGTEPDLVARAARQRASSAA